MGIQNASATTNRTRVHVCRVVRHKRSGTAMFETVLILPLIFVLLGLIFFFGEAFEREQQQRILARYDVARVANQMTPATPEQPLGLQNQQAELNELFFDNKADYTDIQWHNYTAPAIDQLNSLATNRSIPTGDLAWRTFRVAPAGTSIKLSLDFARSDTLPEAVKGSMVRTSTHPGPSWGYADAIQGVASPSLLATDFYQGRWVYERRSPVLDADRAIRDTFYKDFDQRLDDFSPPATRMVGLIRGLLYASEPGYRGPTVRYNR